eukprot:TRINITY_DN11516_c0_g1_i1.p2 TRINITY_DN11516_c0_g1~~TRINITY_DN11516_c0_g1_i1.p2  ORF type:complete len:426 (+),score=81.04 TRINITY_DN11516_c0_g1_i1:2693-3970(+)
MKLTDDPECSHLERAIQKRLGAGYVRVSAVASAFTSRPEMAQIENTPLRLEQGICCADIPTLSSKQIVAQLESIANFRDITQGIHSLKSGVIYRGATPSQVNLADAACLVQQLRVKTIIDFREASEAEHDCGECRLKKQFKEVELTDKQLPPLSRAIVKRLRKSTFRETESCSEAVEATTSDDVSLSTVDDCFVEALDADALSQPGQHADPGRIQLPEGPVLVRVPYAKRKVMKKVAMGLLKPRQFAAIGSLYIGSVIKPSLREKGKSLAKKQFNKIGLLGFYKVILTHSCQSICAVLRICADASNHPIMLHCSHGKDRTGVTAALLLATLGAPIEAIVADYIQSDEHGTSEEGKARFKEECPELDVEEWARAKEQTLPALFEWIDSEFGSLSAYLDLIGFGAEWRQMLRKAFGRNSSNVSLTFL